MKLTAVIKSPKGYYGEVTAEGKTLKQCLANLVPAMDKLPDEREGVKLLEWTLIYIEVQR